MSRGVAAAALRPIAGATLVPLAGAAAKKAAPAPFVDDEHGFQLVLPDGWQRVEQDTGAGGAAGAPVYKAANDRTGQWLVVISTKGPTDDADADHDGGAAALANFESGFAGAAGYKRLSLQRKEIAPGKPPPGAKTPATKPRKVPAVDLWFTMQRDGKPVVVGARGLMFRSYVLTLVVDAPGTKIPAATRRLLESFAPSPPSAD
jgi:hypothetical protein